MKTVLTLPTFLYAGAAKSGSSWIWTILGEHPEILMSPAKELMFFDRYFERGTAWYESFFERDAQRPAAGELSHNYMLTPEVPQRIRDTYPAMKILFCLREPIERTFSEYLYDQTLFQYVPRREYEEGLSFEDFALKPDIMTQSMYFRNLKPYFDIFPRDQILVMFYDDMKSDPAGFARMLYRFLGVDAGFEAPSLLKRVNAARKPRNKFIAELAFRIGNGVRHAGAPHIVGAIKRCPWFERLLYSSYATSQPRPTLPADVANRLHPHYHAETNALAALIGRDVPATWRTIPTA